MLSTDAVDLLFATYKDVVRCRNHYNAEEISLQAANELLGLILKEDLFLTVGLTIISLLQRIESQLGDEKVISTKTL